MMSIIVDVFVAILLISAIGYGMLLNRRIIALRHDQAALERLATSFHDATVRAEACVSKLKQAAQSSSKILNEGIDEAARVGEDLNFLIDRGKKLGDSLEVSVRSAQLTKSSREKGPEATKTPSSAELAMDVHSVKTNLESRSSKLASADMSRAETFGNEIIKSQVEQEFIKALRAVR
jgi:hypothetical protein